MLVLFPASNHMNYNIVYHFSSAKLKIENEDGILEVSEDPDSPKEVKHMIVAYGFFSVIWSVGGILHSDSKQRLVILFLIIYLLFYNPVKDSYLQ